MERVLFCTTVIKPQVGDVFENQRPRSAKCVDVEDPINTAANCTICRVHEYLHVWIVQHGTKTEGQDVATAQCPGVESVVGVGACFKAGGGLWG